MKALLLSMSVIVLCAAPAAAHHSWATNYRVDGEPVEIAGVISKLDWKNPHVRMEVTVDAGKPTAKTWTIESSSVAQLSRMDVTPDLVRVGQQVTVAGHGGVQNPTALYMTHLRLPDRREIVFSVGAKPRWGNASISDSSKLTGSVIETDINKRPASILAVWTVVYGDRNSHSSSNSRVAAVRNGAGTTVTNLVGAPSAGPAPASADYCSPKPLPQAMGAPYPIQLLKTGNNVAIKMEEYDVTRTVRMGATHDDAAAPRSLMGYSTGVWEGQGDKKLVVTTTKIDNKALGARARLTETFELSADRNRLQYTATVADPDKATPPVTVSRYYQYRPGAKLEPYNCTN